MALTALEFHQSALAQEN